MTTTLQRRKWILGNEYTSNAEGRPVLTTIETNNGLLIAKDVMPHDAKEIVDLHNAHIVDRVAPRMLEALENTLLAFEDRYDGAPDAGYQWMGELMFEIQQALAKAKGGGR